MKWLKTFGSESILIRLGICIGMVVILALVSIASSAIFSERSSGKAQAINFAGSLRMQAYVVATQMLEARAGAPHGLEPAMREFERRVAQPALIADLSTDAQDPQRAALRRIAATWQAETAPAVRAAAAGGSSAAALESIDAMVARVDELVRTIAQETERQVRLLRLVAVLSLVVILMVMAITAFLMHFQVYLPITDLLRCARAVRGNDLSARAGHVEDDELGQLGAAFNTMIEELSQTYAGLEARVEEKTQALAHSNRSLELLYGIARKLAVQEVNGETLKDVLVEVARVVDLSAGAICACDQDGQQGLPLAELVDGAGAGLDACRQGQCGACIGDGRMHVREADAPGGARIVTIPLVDGGCHYGMMPLALPAGRELAPWQWQLLEAVGSQIGAALAAARRHEERHRLALLEERSALARELHDSLAQSLSYLKIQVARLQSMFSGMMPAPASGIGEVVAELKSGLSSAYRQLRELLTTFRLGMDGRGLGVALEDTLQEFGRRSALHLTLNNQLLGIELDANEEIHVLQVIREALSNVEHHARAQAAQVRLEHLSDGTIRVRIEDDGVGLQEASAPTHHYGLAIMRDRAASLGGVLQVDTRAGGGTCVELRFAPAALRRPVIAVAGGGKGAWA